MKDDRIEAVFVATDAPSQARHCIEVLKHGMHVACAVPAVFGYNILLKRNKAIQDVLREFTGDLEAYLIGGVRPELGQGAARPAAPAAKK